MGSPVVMVVLLLLTNAAGVAVALAWLKRQKRLRPVTEHPPIGSILPFALAASFAVFMIGWSVLHDRPAKVAAIACGLPLILLLSATADLVKRRSVRIAFIAAATAIAAGWSFLLYTGA